MFEPDVSNYLVVLFCVLILRSEIRIDPLLTSKNQRLNLTLYSYLEMFYLNTIEQLFLFVEQLFQLEVCLTYSRLLAGIPILAVFQNLRWNSNKTPLK